MKCDFHYNVTGSDCCCTRASIQDVSSMQDQKEDVDFARLETLLRRTILQVRGQKTERQVTELIVIRERADGREIRQYTGQNTNIYKANMPNIYWFHLLQCENVLLFSVSSQGKLNIFGFWVWIVIYVCIYMWCITHTHTELWYRRYFSLFSDILIRWSND